MVDMHHDQDLVNAILAGNRHAFTILVKKHERLVFYLVHRLVGDEDKSKDVCQEVFVKVYLKIDKFQFQSKLSTWIATIAYREALNFLKKEKADLHEDEKKIENANYKLSYNDAHLEIEKAELKEQMSILIEQLPYQYKTVLTLYHLNEFSYKEIYDITGWPEGTVKNYLFRARKLLKDAIKDQKEILEYTTAKK